MLRTLAVLAAMAPAAALADVDFLREDSRFLPVYPSGQGGFTVGRRIGVGQGRTTLPRMV